MAAVLCKGCATCFGEVCKLLTIPCKMCGECCGILADGISQLCTNPFCFFVAVSLAINISSITAGITSVASYGLNCMGSTWQIGNITFCAINIIAAFYIALRFNHLRENPTQSSSGTNTHNSGMKKVSDILCHDPYVALYILILIGFFVWLGIGVSWRANGEMWCGDDGSIALSNTSLACGYSYFGTGFFSLCLSICCSCCCCNEDRRGGPNPYYSQQQYGSTPSSTTNSIPPQTHTSHQSSPPSTNPKYHGATYTRADPVTATPVVGSQQSPIQATVVNDGGLSIDEEADAVAKGSAFGARIGKLFNAHDQTKSKLESAGAKANVAMTQSLSKAQKFMGVNKK